MLIKLLPFVGIALLFACEEPEIAEKKVAEIDEYFDVEGLLASNAEELLRREVKMAKIASFDGEVEKTVVRLDSAAIIRELDVFRDADINKPEFSESYIKEVKEENGLQVITYVAEDKEDLNVNYLKVYLNAEAEEVERLEALFSNRNILYNSTRLLKVEYGEVKGVRLPMGYTIEGVQKMIFSEPAKYAIKAEFEY
ncbi:hypothetical protein [Nafulsella turpanensis]|uniref:hypothetical protein n=1 Tax=Nafulsella turpanensis TaxID=1265690 RepID=UPI0003450509|nr:hypothetical protein [Nafulsella turpanensis]